MENVWILSREHSSNDHEVRSVLGSQKLAEMAMMNAVYPVETRYDDFDVESLLDEIRVYNKKNLKDGYMVYDGYIIEKWDVNNG